jgi:hypothetical protein
MVCECGTGVNEAEAKEDESEEEWKKELERIIKERYVPKSAEEVIIEAYDLDPECYSAAEEAVALASQKLRENIRKYWGDEEEVLRQWPIIDGSWAAWGVILKLCSKRNREGPYSREGVMRETLREIAKVYEAEARRQKEKWKQKRWKLFSKEARKEAEEAKLWYLTYLTTANQLYEMLSTYKEK